MEKYKLLVLPIVLVISLVVYAADGEFFKSQIRTIENSAQEPPPINVVTYSRYGDKSASEIVPTVMVDGKLYSSLGSESGVDARCGVMDGTITASVDAGSLPYKNNQSNFGAGYDYQYGPDSDTIEVSIGGKWMVFKTNETAI